MNPSTDAIVVCGLLLIAVLLVIHFISYRPKKVSVSDFTRLEQRYFESCVYNDQQRRVFDAEKEAESALRKGLIDGIEDIPSGFRQ